MPRKYTRKTNFASYSKNLLRQAINEVKSGTSVASVANELNIPRTTLRHHLAGSVGKWGRTTIFSAMQENVLEKRVLHLCDRGFPMSIMEFRKVAFRFAKVLKRRKQILNVPEKWYDEEMASKEWWLSFKQRHTSVSIRCPENLSASRAEAFNQERICRFFESLETFVEENELTNFPQLIYNADETGLSSVPSNSGKVIAKKGERTVQCITTGERGTLTTVLPCANAIGQFIPPLLIFKGQLLPNKLEFPNGTIIHGSKSGYIDCDIFLSFLRHFDKFRVKVPSKKCLLIVDGHSTHISVDAIEFAMNHGIEMICLPPHTSHRLQPMDTHLNKNLKKQWSSNLKSFLISADKCQLTRADFHKVFNNSWKVATAKRSLMMDAFEYCGLYPTKNTCVAKDFIKSKNFVSDNATTVAKSNYTNNDHTSNILRTLISSPQKNSNVAHTKPHSFHVSSPAYIAKRKLSTDKKKKIEVQKKARKEHQGSSSSFNCIVCGDAWDDASGDWYKCTHCLNWACEGCFSINNCANCEN